MEALGEVLRLFQSGIWGDKVLSEKVKVVLQSFGLFCVCTGRTGFQRVQVSGSGSLGIIVMILDCYRDPVPHSHVSMNTLTLNPEPFRMLQGFGVEGFNCCN